MLNVCMFDVKMIEQMEKLNSSFSKGIHGGSLQLLSVYFVYPAVAAVKRIGPDQHSSVSR